MLEKLTPQNLWKNFENICSIPHPSKHEYELAKFILKFGQSLNLETEIDSTGNIRIRKPATIGFENRKTVILQAHIDMVPQKNSDIDHNFEKDPIKPFIDGEWVTAENTTLGADNGIGAASIMAILEDNSIEHGPIEALFTTDEETGMTGAFGLQPGFLEGDILLNTDTEDEDEIIIGCAGGIEAIINIPIEKKNCPSDLDQFDINIKGLKGGHSGIDINLGRANANKLMSSILKGLSEKFDLFVTAINGGNMLNAIPREATLSIAINPGNTEELTNYIKTKESEIIKTFSGIENNIRVNVIASQNKATKYIDKEYIQKIMDTINTSPNGVVSYVPEMENVVETSLNLSIIKTNSDHIETDILIRSSDESKKTEVCTIIENSFKKTNANIEFTRDYPGWKPSKSSEILETMSQRYKEVMQKKPDIKVVHAGLECGIIGSIFPHLDMISFGPTIQYPHSPDERVNIASVNKYWHLLIDVLMNIPKNR